MEAPVHLAVALLVGFDDVSLGEDRVAFREDVAQISEYLRAGAALGELPRREAFQRAAHIHALRDFGDRERAHGETARARGHQQAFPREHGQGLAHRRAGHPQSLGDLRLGDALAGRERSLQDHLPDARQHF